MSSKVVVIDARMVGPIPHGISRYVSALARGLSRQNSLPFEPVFLRNQGDSFFGFRSLKSRAQFLSPLELFEIPRLLDASNAAVYHSPSFSSLFAYGPARARCPWVVTLHDLIHLNYGNAFHPLYYRALVKPFALKAKKVVTVSEFSRGELATWLHRPAHTIEVAYNAMEESLLTTPSVEESRKVLTKFGVERGRYFFCLSNPKPHKNIPFLIRAYSRYRAEQPLAWSLVLSVQGFDGAEGVIQTGGLADEEVRVLRANSGAVVFPSLEEGFGLPPVEAALAGVPVIASKIPPHEEGLRDVESVGWVDPRDELSVGRAFQLVQAGQIAAASADARRKILSRFSEEALARKMSSIYAEITE